MGRLVTISDVARRAGVSRQTVSNVLNAPEVVRAETRERVRAAIAELGYRPHASARRLRTQRSATIGVRLDAYENGISGVLLDRYLHALVGRAEAKGLRVVLYTAQDAVDELLQLARLVDGADVDYFVLTSTYHGDPRIGWLIERGQHFVTFGRQWGVADPERPGHYWVDVDGRAGTREATRRLLDAGRRCVGYIGWPAGSGTGDERRRGWADAAGAGPAVEAVDEVGAGRAAMLELLAREPSVDAVVAASDTLAFGALLAVGGGLPVVGFDNTPVAEAIGFSSVDQQLDEVAAATLELLETIGTAPAAHRLVAPRLVERRGAPNLLG